MKKLMIAAAVICAAAFAQAASSEWATAEIYKFVDPATTVGDEDYAPNSYLVYFVDAADYDYASAQLALDGGDTSFISTYGKIGELDSGYGAGVVEGYGDGQSITAYAVVLNADSIEKATYAFLSETDTQSTGNKGQAALHGFDTTASQVGSNWYAVPEPTSGLLLLLGVAGLVLRRRRA